MHVLSKGLFVVDRLSRSGAVVIEPIGGCEYHVVLTMTVV